MEVHQVIHGAPAVDADAQGLGVGNPEAGFYGQVAGLMGGNVDGVADLGFLHAEAVVGVLHRGAHIHAAQAYFKVQPVDFKAGTGGGSKGVLEVSFRVLVVGVPAVGHHAERIAKAQRINAFAGREGESGMGSGDGRIGGGGKGPLQGNGLLGIGKQGNKQEGKQKGRGAENTYAPAVCWCRRRSRAVSRLQEYGFRRMPSVGYVTSALRIQMQFSFGAAVCIRNTGA